MDTLQTQDVVDGEYSSEEDALNDIWGKLYPLGSSFSTIDLRKDEYTFGRGESCDYPFNTSPLKQHQCFQAYSKVHFRLARQNTNTGTHVFLEDMSSNGTFINGIKVGKGNKHVLNNNDEIALALKKNKAFVFLDLLIGDDIKLPKELSDQYTLTRLLGRGACGEVKLAFKKGSCQKFAVKIISKKKFSIGGKNQLNLTQHVMSEVRILKSLKHPCIIGIEDVIDTDDMLYIVLELVEGGELFDRVVEAGQLSEQTAKLLFYQMASAIKYLHEQGVTHRDLKPENILLSTDNADCLIKVTDFGLSKFVDAGSMMKTFCGTPTYLAPEILLTAGNSSYTKAIDVWSLGVILYICLVGYPPFSNERKDMELPKQIIGAHYSFPDRYWSNISHNAKDLIRKMMTVDAHKRLTIDQVLDHPWLQDDAVRTKAHSLMYPPTSTSMLPPRLPAGRKRLSESGGDVVDSKKNALDDTMRDSNKAAEAVCSNGDNTTI